MATLALGIAFQANTFSQAFTQNFDDITTLSASGWYTQNNSSPIGSTSWFQGNNSVFNAFNGATTAYIGANYNNTSGAGTISNWLVTPNATLKNGDVLTFYTRCSGDNLYPDRLQVRLSANGTSTNVGSSATDVGDFTTLLLEINPTQTTSVYPWTGWSLYTITISGLSAPTSGRIAFRYFVTNAGINGTNSDYIGIDNVVYTPYVCPTLSTSPSSLSGGTAGTTYSETLSQTGALGTPSYAVTAGALPPGLSLSTSGAISGTPTATGTFNFTITVSDNSGCSGSTPYSILIECPANPIVFSFASTACSADSLIVLDSATPTGGTYSGTGVSGGAFDPSIGTQSITYDYTDPYGCPHSATASYTVNTTPSAPVLSSNSPICEEDALNLATDNVNNATYVWSGPNGFTSSDEDPVISSATTNEGGTYAAYIIVDGCASATSTTDVTVNPQPTADFSVSNSGYDYSFANNSQDETSVTWDFGDGSATTSDDSPNHTYTENGTYTVTLTATNSCGTSTNTEVVEIFGLSFSESQIASSVSLFPNPSSDFVNLSLEFANTLELQVKLYDMQGRVVFNQPIGQVQGTFHYTIDISSFASGIYQLSMETNQGKITRQLIKK